MTPMGYSGQEKRITFQLYNHWFALTGNGNIPPLTSLVPEDIAPYKNSMVLIDLRDPGQKPTLTVVGQLLIQDLDPDLTLKNIGDIPHNSLLSRITDHYLEVIASQSPISFEAGFNNADDDMIFYRCILLPFSDDGENINFILGAQRWIKQTDKNDCRSTGEDTAGMTVSRLQEQLESCRQLLRGEDSVKIRSRKSLYQALGAIFDFHMLCCASPDSYHQLLATEGLKIQQRAPFTPTLKLCFGRSYDKTRLTEYAATLSFARKNDLDGTSLPNFLARFPGGIKGCVRAERGGKNLPPEYTREKTTENYQNIARDLPALVHFDLPLTDDRNSDEFCLLLARRDGPHMEVIKIMKPDKKIFNHIFKLLGDGP